MSRKTCKTVAYAYASSPHACALGFARSGCHYVGLVTDGVAGDVALKGFVLKSSAFAHADTLPQEYDRYCVKREPVTHYV